jgi:hypothetical protein
VVVWWVLGRWAEDDVEGDVEDEEVVDELQHVFA